MTSNNASSSTPDDVSHADEAPTLPLDANDPITRAEKFDQRTGRPIPDGSAGGLATAARRTRERLAAMQKLPPLTDPNSALKRLDVIGQLAIAGAVPGSQANAASQATRAFIDAHRVALTHSRVKLLEERITQLERENARLRSGT